jgi:hypothetical protein
MPGGTMPVDDEGCAGWGSCEMEPHELEHDNQDLASPTTCTSTSTTVTIAITGSSHSSSSCKRSHDALMNIPDMCQTSGVAELSAAAAQLGALSGVSMYRRLRLMAGLSTLGSSQKPVANGLDSSVPPFSQAKEPTATGDGVLMVNVVDAGSG